MKTFLRLLVVMLFFQSDSFSQTKSVGIRITQDYGIFLKDFETTVYLRKAPFKVQVMFENTSNVFVFANTGDSIYRFSATDTIRDFVYLPILDLKEDPYNAEEELNISRIGWSNWYYDPVKTHPFNPKISTLYGDKIVCTKWVRHFYDVANEKQICLEDVDQPLYLFFIAVAEYDKNGKPAKELLRRKVKIVWVEDYYE